MIYSFYGYLKTILECNYFLPKCTVNAYPPSFNKLNTKQNTPQIKIIYIYKCIYLS